ncbi:tripartite tricarboxylate transporter substrate binding protein [Georgenia satyanarayanai]|uniref:Bug family tripartite tricarboxylate transporter substrate binding protein n=1 Tax=Georgenia satyanarayanai TaxID=860221 RepID=UPI00203FD3ED|nr:tripartite tricarboxylate transporter substrate binding protein [Georgenia satyanarayanai]MCM3660983.1 tripartite tricarboxylate transporter substrate binding protein [Georgenia satyanarayanai]
MKNTKRTAIATVAAVTLLLSACADDGGDADTYPERDVNVTVPFNAGGSTDLTARTVGEAMGNHWGKEIVVTNTPGAGGSVGTQSVLNAKADGYTVLADGMLSFTSMPVMGTLETMPADWDFWLATFTPNIIAVPAESPYETIDDLLQAMEENPGQVSVGTAGPGSAGHIAAELIATAADVEYRHVPYEGGNPAILATLGGEVDFAPQLLVEMHDMLISGDLRGLAALSDEAVTLDGGITIPTLADALPEIADILPMGQTTGLAVPKGLDEGILAAIDEGFEAAMQNQAFLDFSAENGMQAVAIGRADAGDRVAELQSIVAWTLFDAGVAENDPEDFDIPRP